ncbi:helix-turn-helix domain-containing protein [Actinokineospora sp. NPDC004072]
MGGQRKQSQGRDRALGAQLRAIRLERTNLSLERAAEESGYSLSTLSRMENGKRRITSEDVAALLAAYKVPPNLRNSMVENARIGCQTGWWSRGIPGVLPDVGTLASYEVDARTVTDWSINLIPGLLQTRDYAVGFMISDGIPSKDIEARWEARRRRQEVLPKIDYTAFIHEHVLRAPFGGHDAFKIQLQHLCDAYGRGVGIRLLRNIDAALMHSWMLLEFPRASPILYVELMRSSLFLYEEEVHPYEAIRAKIAKAALSAAESRQVIARVLERL